MLKFKKLMILVIVFICQLTSIAYEEDYTHSIEYKNVIKNVRQKNAGDPTHLNTNVMDNSTPIMNYPETVANKTLKNSEGTPKVQPQQVFKSSYLPDNQLRYQNIIDIYNQVSKNKDNHNLQVEYVKEVEDYLNLYGDISLKLENRANYVPIIYKLALLYMEFGEIDNSIKTFEKLSSVDSNNINIQKQLLNLYISANMCVKAKKLLRIVQYHEPSYNINLNSCAEDVDPLEKNEVLDKNNTINASSPSNPEKDNYNWDLIYLVYFGIWGLIFLLCINIDKLELDNELDNEYNYYVEYNDNYPIKPTIEDFGFDKTSYENICNVLNNKFDSDYRGYFMVIISMFIVTFIFKAPECVFPIFKTGWGLLFGLIFLFISSKAFNILISKCILLYYNKKIKRYNDYNSAIKIYEEEKRKVEELERRKRYQQEEYRRKQLENQRLEQERKQKEFEEYKRNSIKRAQRLQKDFWYNIDPFEFEIEIGELFKGLGYITTVTKERGDGGIDIIIEKGNKVTVVQCKRYKSRVGAPEIQAFWGAKDYFEYNGKFIKADGAIMIALSGVTERAKKIIQHFPNYELWTIDTIIAKANEVSYNYQN